MKIKFQVTGMTCAACSARVEKVTNSVNGVEKAEVNLLGGTMVVDTANESVVEEIISAIQKAGYRSEEHTALHGQIKNSKKKLQRSRTMPCMK